MGNVSFKALGIWHTLKAMEKQGLKVNMEQFAKKTETGLPSVRSGFRELIKHGYVNKIQVREGNVLVSWVVQTCEQPPFSFSKE